MKKYSRGFICGFFDILHDGHIDILKQAKEMCDYLIVAVGTDLFMQERKHRNSILSYEQRVEIVSAIKYVDEVVPEVNLDKLAAYEQYHFDVMFAGDDHINEQVYVEAVSELKRRGVDTIYISRKRPVSSTLLREKVRLLYNDKTEIK